MQSSSSHHWLKIQQHNLIAQRWNMHS